MATKGHAKAETPANATAETGTGATADIEAVAVGETEQGIKSGAGEISEAGGNLFGAA